MLRLHFTPADVAGVRLTLLGPLAETELALANLQQHDRRALFGNWRSRTGPRISPEGRDVARSLAHPAGGLVDLFTLTGPATCIDEGTELLRQAPHERLADELAFTPELARTGRRGWAGSWNATGRRPTNWSGPSPTATRAPSHPTGPGSTTTCRPT